MANVGMSVKYSASYVLLVSLVLSTGCEPEMPLPPPRESTNPAEDEFAWAMERMEHAIDQFQPAAMLGLRVRRQLAYELIPPTDNENYRATVTISTLTVYQPPVPTSGKDDRKNKKDAKEDLADPFVVPSGDPTGETEPVIPPVPRSQVEKREVPDPPLPMQEIKEKKEYLLEFVDDQWQVRTKELGEHERMWFDYALQQGEFAPGAAGKL